MKAAGIKVWVLTGDKIETAMNIGLSAGLLDNQMDTFVVEEVDHNLLYAQLQQVNADVKANVSKQTNRK